MKKFIIAAAIVLSTGFSVANAATGTKKDIGTADTKKDIGTADTKKDIGTADTKKDIGTADTKKTLVLPTNCTTKHITYSTSEHNT
ncbi:hypothetical protein CKK33_10010 [Mucilaginibacter sp. MD40]|uniref:hypothetical protein n=1 Tax=Mucilaginibacter sp. MD40 TaxID=2029590 RepID=UPI000BAC6486|nr:hypothetical protein [Mucilaginibacter sp. MD40]PAW93811.1 hypothetical protein CKK33_10010 [Mucilaginibacter sp. MD40]